MVNEIKVGDRVRSYDFPETKDDPSRPPCYVEGVVVGIVNWEGCDRYEIECTKRIVCGVESTDEAGTSFFPPVNGTRSIFGGVTKGVEKIAA